MKLDRFSLPGTAKFKDFRETLRGKLDSLTVPFEALRFIERVGQRRRDFTAEDSERPFVEIVPSMGTIQVETPESAGGAPAAVTASAASTAAATPETKASPLPSPVATAAPKEAPKAAEPASSVSTSQEVAASSVPSHWLSSPSATSPAPAAATSPSVAAVTTLADIGKKSGKGKRKGPISSDDANGAGAGVGKIREVLQDVLRAASSLQGNPDAEEELCREVSVAAARVLSQHGAHRLLSTGLPSTDESFREQLKKTIAAQLDTFQKELYKQNCFLQKVPSDVINEEQHRMWEQALNQSLIEALKQDAQENVRWIRILATEKHVRLRDPQQEARENTLMSTLAQNIGAP